jgi:uncharacterized protein with HEPN domain
VTADRTSDRLSLAIEHLQTAIEYARRGREVFFDRSVPDTRLLVEAELRKAYEALNRLGDSFFRSQPRIDRSRIGEVRQRLTHDYTIVRPKEVWSLVTDEAPRLLRTLRPIRPPKV